jgi:hypothetical protein
MEERRRKRPEGNRIMLALVFTALFIFLFFFHSLSCAGFDWPVEKKVLMATFGERRYGHFFSGIDLGGGEQLVFPIADGEVIFFHEEASRFHSLKRGNGSFIVLQHEGGIRSVYSHLKRGTVRKETSLFQAKPKQIKREAFNKSILNKLSDESDRNAMLKGYVNHGDYYSLREELTGSEKAIIWDKLVRVGFIKPLGISGDTGISKGVHLALMIIDHEENTILNPIKKDKSPLQPILEAERDAGPIIESVYLRRGGNIIELKENLKVAPGDGEILARIYDKSEFVTFNRNMAPYRLYLADSGKVVSTLTFVSLEAKEDRLVISNTNLDCDDLYYEDWFYRLGGLTLVEGKSQIQIRAEDFSGRESSVDISLWVTSE